MTDPSHVLNTTLDNGLQVVLKEMHTAPVVSCWTLYRVGSRCEHRGITGVSHWCEHMMFKGSPRWDRSAVFTRISACGGYLNAFTTEDFTGYYETVPADHADLPLDIESDRMVNALFDPEELESERSVIISEWEGLENDPESCLFEAVKAAAYTVHPYHWPVIGYRCDIEQMTREDLLGYYRHWYTPYNALLAVAGDFRAEEMVERIHEHFGAIRGPALQPEVRAVEPPQQGERRVEIQRPGASVYLALGFHVPAFGHEDMYPLIVLDSILTGAKPLSLSGGINLDRSSRLFQALVDRKQVAVEVTTRLPLNLDPGLWTFHVMLQDEVKPQHAERMLLNELDRIATRGPAKKEMRKALNQTRAQIEYSRDGVADNAFLMGYFEMMGDRALIQRLIERVSAVTREDVVRVAETYLCRKNRTVGWFLPTDGNGGGSTHAPDSPGFRRPLSVCFLSDDRKYPLLREHRFDNGVRLIGVENPDGHAVAVRASVDAGAEDDPPGREGLAVLASAMLDEGTEKHSCRQIAERLETAGVFLDFDAGIHHTGFEAVCLKRTLTLALKTGLECLAESSVPPEEFLKVRQQTVTVLRSKLDSTEEMAYEELFKHLYPPGHPFHEDAMGTIESVQQIEREDVLGFMRAHYTPGRMLVSVAGPLRFSAMVDAVGKVFGQWRTPPRKPSSRQWPEPEPAAGEEVFTVPLPGKTQCDIVIGRHAVPRRHPDRFPIRIANSILGQFGLMGRIGEHVRERLGLAYYCFSEVKTYRRAGQWLIYAGVSPDNVERTLDAIRHETQMLCNEPVTDEELGNTKGQMLGSLPLRVERSQSLVALAHSAGLYELGLDYLQRAEQAVGAITREDVRRAAGKYLAAQPPIVTIAGPPGLTVG